VENLRALFAKPEFRPFVKKFGGDLSSFIRVADQMYARFEVATLGRTELEQKVMPLMMEGMRQCFTTMAMTTRHISPEPKHTNGSLVRGLVVLDLENDVRCEEVLVVLRCVRKIGFTSRLSADKEAEDILYEQEFGLFRPTWHELASGVHRFPFGIRVPDLVEEELPSSAFWSGPGESGEGHMEIEWSVQGYLQKSADRSMDDWFTQRTPIDVQKGSPITGTMMDLSMEMNTSATRLWRGGGGPQKEILEQEVTLMHEMPARQAQEDYLTLLPGEEVNLSANVIGTGFQGSVPSLEMRMIQEVTLRCEDTEWKSRTHLIEPECSGYPMFTFPNLADFFAGNLQAGRTARLSMEVPENVFPSSLPEEFGGMLEVRNWIELGFAKSLEEEKPALFRANTYRKTVNRTKSIMLNRSATMESLAPGVGDKARDDPNSIRWFFTPSKTSTRIGSPIPERGGRRLGEHPAEVMSTNEGVFRPGDGEKLTSLECYLQTSSKPEKKDLGLHWHMEHPELN